MTDDRPPKPPRVALIQRLLWLSAGLGGIALGLDLAVAVVSEGDWLYRGLMALHIAFLGLIAHVLGLGRNWARVAYILPTLLGLNPVRLFLPEGGLGQSPVGSGLALAMIAVQTLAFFLMFTRPVCAWFKRLAPNGVAKPWRPGIEGELSAGPEHTANY